MINKYFRNIANTAAVLISALAMSSCSKHNNTPKPVTPVIATPAKLGLVQFGFLDANKDTDKRIFVPITQVGTQKVDYAVFFDTGSTGLTMDAHGLIPASMITTSGLQFTGDSTTVNGITITNQTATMSYGDANSPTVETGNLAYASFTVGDNTGNISIKRVPFFMYYMINGSTKYPDHELDIFGVGPGYSFTNSNIVSPLSVYDAGSGLTRGFKLAMLNNGDFSLGDNGKFVTGLFTVGLTPTDRFSSGFIMHTLEYSSDGGYSPNIPATITYGNTSTSTQILFDTGTPLITVIEDKNANSVKKSLNSVGALPSGSVVSITTNRGFKFSYKVDANDNLTTVQNPNSANDYRSIISLNFFTQNEFLTDYDNNIIGLKNK